MKNDRNSSCLVQLIPFRRACAALLFFLLVNQLTASTLVSGNVSGTWTKTGSPYMVVDTCTVPSDQTLTIQPGTTVIIGEGLNLNVDGRILANGTPSDGITFKGTTASNYWGQIGLSYNGKINSQFTHCNISDANCGLSLYIGELDATMQSAVSDSIFSNCKTCCIWVGAYGNVWAPGWDPQSPRNNPIISNCRFSKSPIGVDVVTQVATSNLQIKNCVFDFISAVAISLRIGNYPGVSNPLIVNNVFRNCIVGIDTIDPFDIGFYNNIITDTKIAIKRSGTLSSKVAYTCFFNNNTNFVGYPSTYGKVVVQNANGTPSDIAMNIFVNPFFAEALNYTLATNSPCIDAGDPTPVYNDIKFPPSLGTEINDMGAYGGPNAVALGDADSDGLPDTWEIKYFGDISKYGPQDDPDGDGLTNLQEFQYGTDPTKTDTDGDGFNDPTEIETGSDPLNPSSTPPPVLAIDVEQVRLSFIAGNGKTNLIQASSDLKNWPTVEQIIGTGDKVSRTYGVTNGMRYFRLSQP